MSREQTPRWTLWRCYVAGVGVFAGVLLAASWLGASDWAAITSAGLAMVGVVTYLANRLANHNTTAGGDGGEQHE